MNTISRPSNLTLDMVKERDNQPHTDYLHIFKLQEDDNMLSITHEQEQPAYKLEYHTNYVKNQNAIPKKVYVIREDDVDVFICDAFTRRILKGGTNMKTIKSTIRTEAIFSKDENTAIYSRKHGMKRNPLVQ